MAPLSCSVTLQLQREQQDFATSAGQKSLRTRMDSGDSAHLCGVKPIFASYNKGFFRCASYRIFGHDFLPMGMQIVMSEAYLG
jgi:hypothetical protein